MTLTAPHTTGLKAATAALVVLLLGVLWAGLLYHLADQRRLQLDHAVASTAQINRVHAAQVQSVLGAVDQTLRLLQRLYVHHPEVSGLPVPTADDALLRTARARTRIVTAEGWTTAGEASEWVGDADWYRVHVERDAGMAIGAPAATADTATITLSRRLSAPDGTFAGVVAVSLNPAILDAALLPSERPPGSAMALVGLDRVIRMVSGPVPPGLRQDEATDAAAAFALDPTEPDGARITAGAADGVERITAWRTLDDYPARVVSSVETRRILADEARNRAVLVAATAAISAIFVIAGLGLLRMLGQREDLVASLAHSRAGLIEAQRLGRIGHWVADLRRGQVRFSDECFAIMGRPPESAIAVDQALTVIHPDDRARYLAFRNGAGGEIEMRIVRPDGSTRWVQSSLRPQYDPTGARVSLFGVVQDITERKVAETALHASEERYRLLVDGSREGIYDRDYRTGDIWLSTRVHELLGLPDGALNGPLVHYAGRIHPDDLEAYEQRLADRLAAREPYNADTFRVLHADGTWRWMAIRGRLVYADDGTPLRAVGSLGDITARKITQTALLESNRRLLETERLGRIGSIVWDRASDRVTWSDSLFELRGVSPRHSFSRAESLAFVHPDDQPAYLAARDAGVARRRDFVCDTRVVRPDGTICYEHAIGHPRFDEAGELIGIHLVIQDVTEIRATELALRRSEERYALALDAMREGLYDRDFKTGTIWFSHHIHELLGLPDGALNGERARFAALIHPDDRPGYEAFAARFIAARQPYATSSFRVRRADGEWRWIVFRCATQYDDAGAPTRSIGSMGDITEQKLAEEALHTRERELAAILDNAPVGIHLKDRDRRYRLVNRQHALSRGCTVEQMIGRTDDEILGVANPPSRAGDEAVLNHGEISRIEYPPIVPRPGIELVEVLKFPIIGETGEVTGLAGFTTNVTERHQIEAQLRQAAKMEAVGRLASGIAHDFNNMVGAIGGFSSFLVEDLPEGSPEHGYAVRIAKVCDHAKDVVRQILAFSRADAVENQLLDLREALASDAALVRAVLPASTALTLEPGADALVVRVNPGQFHQIALNLCRNASDALGGRPGMVSVRLAHIGADHPDRQRFDLGTEPGAEQGAAVARGGRLQAGQAYAALTVVDTGCGMSQAILDQIFEPFFTTKHTGLGTGLGLAVIDSIVAAHGGAYRVTSRPGHGSAFTIYLPLVDGVAPAATTAPLAANDDTGHAPRGSESILVVDDERDVADMVAIGLERLGYEVTCSNDPLEALQAVEADPAAWDLVITDHSMPGLNGGDLAARIKAITPRCPIILYTARADALEPASLPAVDRIVSKQVAARSLVEHVRALLDAAAAAARSQRRHGTTP